MDSAGKGNTYKTRFTNRIFLNGKTDMDNLYVLIPIRFRDKDLHQRSDSGQQQNRTQNHQGICKASYTPQSCIHGYLDVKTFFCEVVNVQMVLLNKNSLFSNIKHYLSSSSCLVAS